MTTHTETHPLATAAQIVAVLGTPEASANPLARHMVDGNTGNIVLTNAQARRLLALAEKGHSLSDVYHAVYDVKDTLEQGSPAFYAAYEALGKIADLITVLGSIPPVRFDRQGR